jgi:hypothetical protein
MVLGGMRPLVNTRRRGSYFLEERVMDAEFRQLPVKLTKNEVLTKGKLAAKADIALGELEDQKAEVTKDYAERIKLKRKELDQLAREIDTGTEVRPVKCTPVARWRDYMMDIVRDDTRETVESRPMTHAERQMALDLEEMGDREPDEMEGEVIGFLPADASPDAEADAH